MKNEKVAKGRIIGLAGPCYNMNNSLLSSLILTNFKSTQLSKNAQNCHHLQAEVPCAAS